MRSWKKTLRSANGRIWGRTWNEPINRHQMDDLVYNVAQAIMPKEQADNNHRPAYKQLFFIKL
ncbi:MAG: hypothetical protein G3M70_07905 [Candidatus Nitronauta litoralis]|uniref:Uncharacterized protein n=1 Tax=Candidatus Nitronauta litoralis TaxID=2705533 RepID=A0A7T0BVU0_9BACT|nr:MAG: hypothetical protein G3M70_07905 [Candidatus Nitronauta litoralis]